MALALPVNSTSLALLSMNISFSGISENLGTSLLDNSQLPSQPKMTQAELEKFDKEGEKIFNLLLNKHYIVMEADKITLTLPHKLPLSDEQSSLKESAPTSFIWRAATAVKTLIRTGWQFFNNIFFPDEPDKQVIHRMESNLSSAENFAKFKKQAIRIIQSEYLTSVVLEEGMVNFQQQENIGDAVIVPANTTSQTKPDADMLSTNDCDSCPTIQQLRYPTLVVLDEEKAEVRFNPGEIFIVEGDKCEHPSYDRLQVKIERTKNGYFADRYSPDQPIAVWDAVSPPKDRLFFHYQHADTSSCLEPSATVTVSYSNSTISSKCSVQHNVEFLFHLTPHIDVHTPRDLVISREDGIGTVNITESDIKVYEYGYNCSGMVSTDRFYFETGSSWGRELYFNKDGEHVRQFTQEDLKAGRISVSANCTTRMDQYEGTIIPYDSYHSNGEAKEIIARCDYTCNSCPTIEQIGGDLLIVEDGKVSFDSRIFNVTGDECWHPPGDLLQVNIDSSRNGFFASSDDHDHPITFWDVNSPPRGLIFKYRLTDLHEVEPAATLIPGYSISPMPGECFEPWHVRDVILHMQFRFKTIVHLDVSNTPINMTVLSNDLGVANISTNHIHAYRHQTCSDCFVSSEYMQIDVLSGNISFHLDDKLVYQFTQEDVEAGRISLSANCTTDNEHRARLIATDTYHPLESAPAEITARCFRPPPPPPPPPFPYALVFGSIGGFLVAAFVGIAGVRLFYIHEQKRFAPLLTPLVERILTDKCPLLVEDLLLLYKGNPNSLCFTPDLHIYDRAMLQPWVRVHHTDPLSRVPLQISDLRSFNWVTRPLINAEIKKLKLQSATQKTAELQPLLSETRVTLFPASSAASSTQSSTPRGTLRVRSPSLQG